MGELSARMMVTGGNVTGIVDQLETEGPGRAQRAPSDRRAFRVRLTPPAAPVPPQWPPVHEAWIVELLRRLGPAQKNQVHGLLATLKPHQHLDAAARRTHDPRDGFAPSGGNRRTTAELEAAHFGWRVEGRVGVITLNRPERKNPLTFDSVRRAARSVPHARPCRRRARGGGSGRRAATSARRRRARDHRPAGGHAHAGPARLHAHDRRSGEGDARLPASPSSPRSMACARRRRDRRDGVRPARRHGAQQGGVSVHARRPGWLRHGRLRHAAAHRRPGRAPSCFTPAARCPARRRWPGVSNRLAEPEALGRGHRHRAPNCRRPELRPRDDQAHAAPGVVHGRDEAIEAEAQAQAICMATQDFRAPTRPSSTAQPVFQPVFEGDRRMKHHLDWPFFEDAPPRTGGAPRRLVAQHLRMPATTPTSMRNAATLVRALGAAAGCAMRWPARRTAARPRPSTRARSACCARRWPATAWPISPSRCRGWARARSRWRARPRSASAGCRAWRGLGDRGLRAVRARGRIDVGAMRCAARATTATPS